MSGLLAELSGPSRSGGLVEQARVLGGLAYVEWALFERLGGVAPLLEDPAQTIWASSASLRAAWRAEALFSLLPVSVGLPGAKACTVSPGPNVDGALHLPAELGGGEALGRTATWYEALLAVYATRASQLSEASDGPLGRVLARLMRDLTADLEILRGLTGVPGRGA